MHPYWTLLARLILGGTWTAAGTAKLARGGFSGETVADFDLLPRRLADAAGRALPWVEPTLGLLLLAGLRTTAAAGASAALLGLFSAAIGINLARGRRIACHCFGQMGHGPISGWSVARNTGLLAIALGLAIFRSDYLAADGLRTGTALGPADPAAVDFVPVLLIALTALILWALAASAWEVARAVARAEGGPALGMPERRLLRRWTAGEPSVRAATAGHASGTSGHEGR